MKRRIKLLILGFIFILCLTGCQKPSIKSEEKVIDGISFKAEYEEYNDEEYYNLNIKKENPMKYVVEDNYKDILNSSNVIYIGYASSNICRNVVDILLNNVDIKNIYYININKIREKIDIENDEPKVVKEGTEEYKYLLNYLSSYTEDYIISKDSKVYNTNTKIIYAPALLFIKNGKIIKYYNFNYNELDDFTNFSKEEQEQIISDIKLYISQIK